MNPARFMCRAAAITTIGMVSWGAPVMATWPHDVHTNVNIYGASNYRNSPRACSDGQGGAFVCWEDFEGAGGCQCGPAPDVLVRHVSRDGIPTGEGLWLSVGGGTAWHRIASDGQGGALIAWYGGEDWPPGIRVQRIGESGTPLWTNGGVCVSPDTAHIDFGTGPVLVADGEGGALIAWVEQRDELGTTFPRVYVQRVGANGLILWGAGGMPAAQTQWEMRNPSLASSPDGGVIVAWEDLRGGDPDIYAQKLDPFWGGYEWPGEYDEDPSSEGVYVAGEPGSVQSKPQVVPDGLEGACVVWEDDRSGNIDLYAQRMNNLGYEAWATGGMAITTANGAQQDFRIDSDGHGGAVVAWRDFRNAGDADVFAQRVDAGGRVLWESNGAPVCRAAGEPTGVHAVTDGSGGIIVSWMDARLGYLDVWAQRVSAEGTVRWQTDGAAVSLAAGDQFNASLTADGRGGAIVVWDDARSDYSREIYGQRIDRSGDLGDPAPLIASVGDVPLDQGGRVKVSWYASYLDADPLYPVETYWVWRSLPEAAALAAIQRGSVLVGDEKEFNVRGEERSNLILRTGGAQGPIFWELYGTQPAAGDAGYSMMVTTTSDSMPQGNPFTLFRVQARHRDGTTFWTSPTDSGYSIDNLAPAPVAGLSATIAGNGLRLHWQRSLEPDFAMFRIYRGATEDFVPAQGNLVAAQADTGYTATLESYVYKLSAVDMHGNESPYRTLVASTMVAVTDALPGALELRTAPNPMHDRLRIGFSLPHPADVTITVFDVTGRVMREVARSRYPEGRHAVEWSVKNNGGRPIPSGAYYVCIEAGPHQLTRRIVVSR